MNHTFSKAGKKVIVSVAAGALLFGSSFATSQTFAAPSTNAVAPSQIPVTPPKEQRWTINKHFTNAEAKNVVATGSQLASYSDWTSFITSFGNAYLGTFLYFYGKSVTAQMAPFNTAIAKGTGVTFKYDYVLPAGVSGGSGNIENRSVVYE